MIKKLITFAILVTSSICVSGCSFNNEDNSEYTYVSSYFDDDTEGNSFLINRAQDLNVIAYSDKTDRQKLKQFNDDYFKNHSLLVFKVINNKNRLRKIKNYSFNEREISISIQNRNINNKNQDYYFYLIKTDKLSTEDFKWIRVYEGNKLFSETMVQKDDYYDFLSNFDLNTKKEPLFKMDKFEDLSCLENYLDIRPKKTTTEDLVTKIEYIGIDLITDITNQHVFHSKPNYLIGITVYFNEQTKESMYEIAKKLQKLEFGAEVLYGINYLA